MPEKKLYRCEIELVYYAFAESPSEAADFAKEAASDVFLSDFTHCEETTGDRVRRDEWDGESLVYHDGEDLKLADALKKSKA